MGEPARVWKAAGVVTGDDAKLPVRQVYVWVITKDKQIVLVSKDDLVWQFPGGKPEAEESLTETAVREVLEETGLDLAEFSDSPRFFGYYIVHEPGQGAVDYLQVRFFIVIDELASALNLHVDNEAEAQAVEDKVAFVKAVDVSTALSYIPWLIDSPECILLGKSGVI